MSEIMVVESRSERDLHREDVRKTLRTVYERYMFVGEREIEDEKPRFITVLASVVASDQQPQPILRTDFFSNTLDPITEKAKHLLDGRKPALDSCQFEEGRIVFIFGPADDARL